MLAKASLSPAGQASHCSGLRILNPGAEDSYPLFRGLRETCDESQLKNELAQQQGERVQRSEDLQLPLG